MHQKRILRNEKHEENKKQHSTYRRHFAEEQLLVLHQLFFSPAQSKEKLKALHRFLRRKSVFLWHPKKQKYFDSAK